MNPNWPANPVTGNDDAQTGDEDNDPYTVDAWNQLIVGALQGVDTPARTPLNNVGDVGDTFQLRQHFFDFARLEIAEQWYPISDYVGWKVHYNFRKADEAVDGVDYNGNRQMNDVLWVDNGTVYEQNHNGF